MTNPTHQELKELRIENQELKQELINMQAELKSEFQDIKLLIHKEWQPINERLDQIEDRLSTLETSQGKDVYEQFENIDRQATEDQKDEFFARMKSLSKEILDD